MRTTSQFTDGRIHVTLWDGAYDLKQELSAAERALYDALLEHYKHGAGRDEFDALVDDLKTCPHSSPVRALHTDMSRRIALDESMSDHDLFMEDMPWRPEDNKRLFAEATEFALAG